MDTVEMPIKEIIPYKNNPRRNDNSVDIVADSIKEFGWQQPIVVDNDNVIIVGHTRYKAAKKLKLKKVSVKVADSLTPEQVKAYRIIDNRSADYSTWDIPLLVDEINALGADWEELLRVQDFDAIMDEYDARIDIDDEVSALLSNEIRLVVVFSEKEAANKAALEISKMDGVVDVHMP